MKVNGSNIAYSSSNETKNWKVPDTGLPNPTTQNDITLSLGERELINIIERGNKDLQETNTRLQYSVHEKSNQVMVKLIDVNTNEVIREIPPEKLVDILCNIVEAAGLLFDRRQ